MAYMVVRNVILILLAMAGFAAVHSLTAGAAVKYRLQRVFDGRLVEGWYRLAYNLFSGVSIAPVLLLSIALPDQVLYVVALPYLLLLLCIQAIGVLGLLWGVFSFDLWRFVGIRQVLAYTAGEPLPLPEETLQQGGIYGIVRHPLYLFVLLMLWPIPVMTLNILVFNVGATLYLVIGSLIEERRLLDAYGETYRSYRQRVPWLIPWPFLKRR
jgi:protein-S-isoprenylcysteine O-methyltransferase Ste14